MAYVETKHCPRCEATRDHVNGECSRCRQRDEHARIAAWNTMSIDERLSDLRRRMEQLERGPATY